MDSPDFGAALRALAGDSPATVADAVAATLQAAGATDVVIYLIDFEQVVLVPVPSTGVHVDAPVHEAVHGSMAGRAYVEQTVVDAPRDDGCRVWVPILEGAERTGVLALTLAAPLTDEIRERCREVGVLAGVMISAQARYTDLFNMLRRRKSMNLAASMQWDLLPPLGLRAVGITSAALLEPAYEVGGDCFDHVVNGVDFDVAIMDAMGHGVRSSMTASLALGAYRHDRREGQPLAHMHESIDAVLAEQMADSFMTGVLMRLGLRTGSLTWISAGHPSPLLLRGGRLVRTLDIQPSLPWGLGGSVAEQGSESLEPGDSVLLYTDGVIEGRSESGEAFGLDRLVELIEKASASRQPTSETLRRLVREVIAHQGDHLRDDATLLLFTWEGAPS
jgi:serine phosphatase RsbU (regulator of sigma subunit)